MLHFIYYSSWMFRFKILLCMWALYMQVSSPPGYGGVGRGKGGKRREVEYFKPLPLICRVSIALLCAETLRSKGCTQLSWSQATEPGQLHSSASIRVTSAFSTDTTLSPPHQGCQPAGKELSWGGETKESQALPSPVTAVKPS